MVKDYFLICNLFCNQSVLSPKSSSLFLFLYIIIRTGEPFLEYRLEEREIKRVGMDGVLSAGNGGNPRLVLSGNNDRLCRYDNPAQLPFRWGECENTKQLTSCHSLRIGP